MVIQKDALFTAAVSQGPMKRFFPYDDGVQPRTFAAAAGGPTLLVGTPVTMDETVGFHKVWSGAEAAAYTITANATPATAGTFLLTINGETTGTIAFNATAATVQAAIEALGSVDIGDVSVAATTGANLGAANAVVTITFAGNLAGVDVNGTATMGGLTGNAHVLAETVAGGDLPEADIVGFVFPNDIILSAAGEVIGAVFILGSVHAEDVVLPAGESQPALDAALRSIELRKLGIIMQGLTGLS